ncbi:MAG: SpoIIE family protein phosphatase [Coriobacteriales bacterium]|nr:SpoIIE family protein phosphatase [Coriobacteriales bacterium]
MGTVITLPEQLEKKLQNQQEYASYTLFTPTGDIVAMSAQYLVEGDPTAGIVCATSTDSRVIKETAFIVMIFASSSLVVYLFMLYLLNSRTKKLIVNPLNTITGAIRSYSKDRSSGNFERRHFATLDIKTNNEFETLSDTLAKMELDVSHYVDEMARITAEKEREEAELRMAARIQESALPNVFPAFPERSEFEIYASMTPAKEVGGDFYDFFLVDDDHLCMVMADVSDKGIPAALFMMKSKTTIALNIMAGKSPSEALKDANSYLCENNDACMFVTVWVGVLEISTGKLVASNAAHEYPVLQRPRGRFALYEDRHAIMVGARKRAKYTDYQMVLRPGSKLFVYTDGVPEATNAEGEMFGLDRMVDALNETRKASPEEILGNMKRSVDDFVRDASQFDDLTMLCLEYKGAKKQP